MSLPAGRSGIVLVVVLGALLASCGGRDRTRPSVVLITIDTLRQDRLGCYGYFRETTPNLDAFAREAILFENAVTPIATTLPAHVSLMTGARPLRHGIRGNLAAFGAALRSAAGLRTAAQVLADCGYETAAFVSAAPLKTHSGIGVGFAVFSEPTGKERRAEETTEEALAWLDSSPERPFFLWLHYFDPHDAYDPPAPHDTLFRTDSTQLRHLKEKRFTYWEHPQIQKINNLYDGEVRYVDEHLARVFESLREAGLYDDTVVVVAGDHGEGLGQHDWVGHDRIHGEQLLVPLLVKPPVSWLGSSANAKPAFRPPGRRREFVSLIDVWPTLVELLALPAPAGLLDRFDGRSLLAAGGRDFVFSQRTEGREEKLGAGRKFSLTGRDWKFVHATHETDALFDLTEDPFETRDVSERLPDLADSLRSRIQDLLADEVAPTEVAGGEELPGRLVEELRALGYVD